MPAGAEFLVEIMSKQQYTRAHQDELIEDRWSAVSLARSRLELMRVCENK